MELELVPAGTFGLEALTALWNRAYEGYFVPMTVTPAFIAGHVRRGRVDLARSLVAQVDGEPVGLSVAAIDGDQAWIGGFGIAAAMRRRGLASRLAQAQCAVFDAAGVAQARLEVIDVNPARAVYEAAGFAVTRTLVSFEAAFAPAGGLEPLDAAALAVRHGRFNLVAPTWRRELASVRAVVEAGDGEAVGTAGGYAVVTGAGGLLDAAAADEAAAEALFRAVATRWPKVRLVDEPQDTAIAGMLKGAETAPFITQFEMVRTRP